MIARGVLSLALAALLTGSTAMAQERGPFPPGGAAGMLPPHEVVTIVRSGGFHPLGRPVRKGLGYELAAIDPYQLEVRVTVDGRTGRIVAVRHDADPFGPGAAGPAHAAYPPSRFGPSASYWRGRESRLAPPRDIPSAGPTAAPSFAPASGPTAGRAPEPAAKPAPGSTAAPVPAPSAGRVPETAAKPAPGSTAAPVPAPSAGPPALSSAPTAPKSVAITAEKLSQAPAPRSDGASSAAKPGMNGAAPHDAGGAIAIVPVAPLD